MTPTVFIQFLKKFVATPSVTVFFHLRPLSTPSVPAVDRYTIDRTSIPNCFRLTIRHGYMDEVVTEDLAMTIHDQLRDFIVREGATAATVASATGARTTHNPNSPLTIRLPNHIPPDHDITDSSSSSKTSPTATTSSTSISSAQTHLATLQKAYATQVVYIVGKEQMRIRAKTRIWRRVALSAFLWLRDNTRSKMASLNIPVERLVEVGFVKEV